MKTVVLSDRCSLIFKEIKTHIFHVSRRQSACIRRVQEITANRENQVQTQHRVLLKDDFLWLTATKERRGGERRETTIERDREGGGALARWKDNSISFPSSDMGDTVRTGLLHPKQNRTGFGCLYVYVSRVQEKYHAPLKSRCRVC